ncbi:hypothetical protein Gohar_021611 [Gossypium harknessii]|uniref:Uncharacterized protein n=1 Tax=Gossypium harknessii TaxID=34285 RepID=A0A7J9ID93_9ROSI|nr:hypothetical protein [Gossypium harknessii]
MIPVVQEFYLELKQREASKPFYEMRSFVKVRVVNVPKYQYRRNIDILNRREGDVDISNGNDNIENIQPGTNNAKCQDVDKICLFKNMAYNRDI